MARFVKNEIQLVQPNQPVLLDGSWWANRKYLFHQDESGIVTLRGIVNNPYVDYAVYQVAYNANIAIPTGGTAATEIALAIARNGEIQPTTIARVNPAAVEDYWHVGASDYIIVPRGMSVDISVENASISPTPATKPAPAINVQNASLIVVRVA